MNANICKTSLIPSFHGKEIFKCFISARKIKNVEVENVNSEILSMGEANDDNEA